MAVIPGRVSATLPCISRCSHSLYTRIRSRSQHSLPLILTGVWSRQEVEIGVVVGRLSASEMCRWMSLTSCKRNCNALQGSRLRVATLSASQMQVKKAYHDTSGLTSRAVSDLQELLQVKTGSNSPVSLVFGRAVTEVEVPASSSWQFQQQFRSANYDSPTVTQSDGRKCPSPEERRRLDILTLKAQKAKWSSSRTQRLSQVPNEIFPPSDLRSICKSRHGDRK